MKYFKFLLIFFLISFFLSNCTKKEQTSIIVEEDVELQMIRAFKEGYDEFIQGDALFAAKKFNEAELIFPQSDWAPIAALMTAYVYYSDDYYTDAIYHLDRYLKVTHNFKIYNSYMFWTNSN